MGMSRYATLGFQIARLLLTTLARTLLSDDG